ncbi:hypothetical protein NY486_23305, partial [Enterobacter hormaechei]|nr:hypothetical protein [Enterobacter hormaechei]
VYKLAAAHAASYALAEARPRRRVRWADGVVSPLEWNTTPVIVARYHAPSPTGLDGLDYRLRRAFNF